MNRRDSNRVPYPDKCKLILLANKEEITPHVVKIRNLSMGGLAVESDKSYASGELVGVTFGNSQEGTTVVNGVIRHCLENDQGHFIIGIRFESI